MRKILSLRYDLRFQLLVIYLLFVGPVVVAGLIFNNQAGQRLREEVRSSDLDLARVIAQSIDDYLESLTEIVDQLGHHSAVINRDADGMEDVFRTLTIGRSDLSAIYMLDPSCRLSYVYLPGIGRGEPGAVISDWGDYFTCAETHTSGFLTPGYRSPITGQPVTTIVNPVRNPQDGSFIGFLALDIRLQYLNGLSLHSVEHRPDEGYSVVLLDGESQVVGRSDFNPVQLLQPLSEVGAGQPSWQAEGPEGEQLLYSYTLLEDSGWGVQLSRPADTAFLISQQFNRGLLAALAIFVIVGLVFWVGLSDRVIRPLQNLAIFSRQIAENGNSTPIVPLESISMADLSGRSDQVGHLVRNLISMEQAIQNRLTELSTLLETSASVVSSLDPAVVLDRILEQVERLLGVEKCAIIALDEKQQVFLSTASRGLSQRYAEQILIHPGEPVSITLQAISTGKPVQIGDIERDARRQDLLARARQEGIRAMVAVPLVTQYSAPAALLVYKQQAHHFSDREVNLLTTFANQATMAIENATLYARSDAALQEQTRRLESLIQSMQDGLILENLSGQILYANRRIAQLIDMPGEHLTGAPVDKIFDLILNNAAQPRETRDAIRTAMGQRGRRRVEFAYRGANGNRFLRLRLFDVTDANDTLLGHGRILQDITRRFELDRMKSSLISTVSHELRSPLAAIKGYATTLLADDVEWDADSQREFLSIISQETDRLADLVADLLDMSRIEAGNLGISRVKSDIGELVERAMDRSHIPLEARLQVEIPADTPLVYVDPQRMVVVLRNLLENAAKFSSEKEMIRVEAEVEGMDLVVRVKDRGIGIPAEIQNKVFESFFRADEGLTRITSGAGLGLAISQGFIRAHGGRIWIESLDKGTCFAFTIPLEIEKAAEEKTPA